MPPLPNVSDVCKVVFSGTNGQYNWAVVTHFSYTGGPPSAADLTTMAGALEALWSTNMLARLSNNIVLTEIQITDLNSSSGAVGTWSGTATGTAGTTDVPGNCAYLIDYPLGTRYRGGHPRSYLPGGIQAFLNDAAHWNTTQAGDVQAAWRLVVAEFYTATYTSFTAASQVCVSYVNKVINPTPPNRRTTPLVYPITQNTLICRAQVASQRRRIGRK